MCFIVNDIRGFTMGKIDVEESLILDSLVKRRSTVVSDKQSAAMLEKNQKRDAIRKVGFSIPRYRTNII